MTETRMVTSFDGTRLRVLDNGMVNAVRTILFLHNFGGSADSWAWVNNFLPNDMRVICLDQRGFGESAAQPEPTTFTVDDMAADAIEVASHCGLGKYTLVGHSMGGKVAFAVAAQNPPGLRDVVLLAPSPPTPEPMTDGDRKAFLESHHSREAALATIRKIIGKPLTPEQTERFVADQMRASDAAWATWIQQGSREVIGSRAADIRVPVRMLSGDADGAIPLDVVRREVGEWLNAPHTVLPGVGHLLNYEAAEAVARFLAV